MSEPILFAIGDVVALPARLHKIAATAIVTDIAGQLLVQVDLGGDYGHIWLDPNELTLAPAPTPGTTHILLIIDKSGSMEPLARDTVGGYNTYLNTLNPDLNIRITTTLFDTTFTTLCVDSTPADAPRLTLGTPSPGVVTYAPGGSTALLEAIGRTIHTFEHTHKLRPSDKVLLVTSTDGEENSSGPEYTWDTTNRMIDLRVATGQWASIYLGQGKDAWRQDRRFSGSTHTVHTTADSAGTQSAYGAISLATVDYAETGDTDKAVKAMRTRTGHPGDKDQP